MHPVVCFCPAQLSDDWFGGLCPASLSIGVTTKAQMKEVENATQECERRELARWLAFRHCFETIPEAFTFELETRLLSELTQYAHKNPLGSCGLP